MKKIAKIVCSFGLCFIMLAFVGCGSENCCDNQYLTLESYNDQNLGVAVSNEGVSLDCTDCNNFVLKGNVKVASNEVLSVYGFGANETHIVSIKLKADKDVDKDEFLLEIKGPNKINTFGKEGLDGDDYTYMLLSVDDVSADKGYTITVKWNAEDEGTVYTIMGSDDLTLE